MNQQNQIKDNYKHLEMLDDETMQMLHEYSEGSPEVIQDIIDSFEPEADKLMEEITRARKSKDTELLRVASHSLSGISGSIGAFRLKQMASDTENAIKAGKTDEAFLIAGAIQSTYDELLQLLKKM
ncbi:MAG: Hpt domain-containing protein [Bacteroidota bacterium]